MSQPEISMSSSSAPARARSILPGIWAQKNACAQDEPATS
jgi:hypothetical protein